MKRIGLLAAAVVLAAFSVPALALGHRAELRVYDRTAERELPVFWKDGRAYVVGQPGDEYRIKLRNRTGEDFLAVVSVDGVNVVSGQTADIDQGGYVVSAGSTTDVKGWRKSLERTAAFYFTNLGDSYAARTDRPDNVGVIGVALFRERWQGPSGYDEYSIDGQKRGKAQPGTAQPESSAGASRPKSAPLGTGHGREERSHATYAEFERASSEPEEVIALYYDSYRNLVARGVIRAHRGGRDPDPFPSQFAPDPSDSYRRSR